MLLDLLPPIHNYISDILTAEVLTFSDGALERWLNLPHVHIIHKIFIYILARVNIRMRLTYSLQNSDSLVQIVERPDQKFHCKADYSIWENLPITLSCWPFNVYK